MLEMFQTISSILGIIKGIRENFPVTKEEVKNLLQSLTEKENLLKKQFEELGERYKQSKLAEHWLTENRDELTKESIHYVLSKYCEELKTFEVDERILNMVIGDYLLLICECLKLWRPDLIDMYLQERPVFELPLPRSIYKDALNFVKERASKNLPVSTFAEIEFYFKYLLEKLS